jgi:hypothetical protein
LPRHIGRNGLIKQGGIGVGEGLALWPASGVTALAWLPRAQVLRAGMTFALSTVLSGLFAIRHSAPPSCLFYRVLGQFPKLALA